jgi:hypothetical protein
MSALCLAAAGPVLVVGVDAEGVPANELVVEASAELVRVGYEVRAPQPQADPKLDALATRRGAAEERYVEGDLDGALGGLRSILDELGAARRLTPEHTAFALSLRLQLAKWLYSSDAEAAEAVLEGVVRADPSLELDEKRYAPKLRALFDKIRAAVLSQPTGTIAVRSIPAGARVLVDGRDLGQTPVTLTQLPIGEHAVWLELGELRSDVRRVTAGDASTVTLDLVDEWARAGGRTFPPSDLDEDALHRLAKGGAVLALTHARAGEAVYVVGVWREELTTRAGVVEVIGGAADVRGLVQGLVNGGALQAEPRPAWLLPPKARAPSGEAGEAGGSWVWIATAVGAGVAVAAGATALGFALIPPTEGRFSVELVP